MIVCCVWRGVDMGQTGISDIEDAGVSSSADNICDGLKPDLFEWPHDSLQ